MRVMSSTSSTWFREAKRAAQLSRVSHTNLIFLSPVEPVNSPDFAKNSAAINESKINPVTTQAGCAQHRDGARDWH
jgi:hypothetical protein